MKLERVAREKDNELKKVGTCNGECCRLTTKAKHFHDNRRDSRCIEVKWVHRIQLPSSFKGVDNLISADGGDEEMLL